MHIRLVPLLDIMLLDSGRDRPNLFLLWLGMSFPSLLLPLLLGCCCLCQSTVIGPNHLLGYGPWRLGHPGWWTLSSYGRHGATPPAINKQQLNNIIYNGSTSLKLEYIIVSTIFMTYNATACRKIVTSDRNVSRSFYRRCRALAVATTGHLTVQCPPP